MKNLSDLELSELLVLTSRMEDEMEVNFLHVYPLIPAKVKKCIADYRAALIAESERRENL